MFKMTHNVYKGFLPLQSVVWTLYMCILYVKLLLCYLYSILKGYLSAYDLMLSR